MKRLLGTLALASALLLAALVGAGTAQATEKIASFETEASTTQAGGHPDLHTSFDLISPGVPEAAENVIVETPDGSLRQPQRGRTVHLGRLRPAGMPAELPGGPDHDSRPLRRHLRSPPRHRADLQHRAHRSLDGPLRVPRADPEHPDPDPGLGADGERLRAQLQGLRDHPGDAPCRRRPHLLGLPRGQRPRKRSASRRGPPAARRAASGLPDTSCLGKPTAVGIPIHPLTVNPNDCNGQTQPTTAQGPDLPGPGALLRSAEQLRARHRL